MLARRRLVAISVVLVSLSSTWISVTAEENPIRLSSPWMPFKLPRFTTDDIEKMKERFAYRSLADRLAYEKTLHAGASPPLSTEAKASLDLVDTPPAENGTVSEHWYLKMWSMSRIDSIQRLHAVTVDEFINRDGLGVSRVLTPGPEYLVSREPEAIDFETAGTLSAEHVTDQPIPLEPETPSSLLSQYKLPQRLALLSFHAFSQDGFAQYGSFGDVKSVQRVAGFKSHAFEYIPHAPIDEENVAVMHSNRRSDPNRWRIVRLELVSLLKHDTPAVYLSEHLPNMAELTDIKTRPLTTFEAGALDTLRAGEELTAQTNGNLIEMVGAIRAANDCMKCHDVPHGTLLGAFSYQLQRDPPIRVLTIGE